MPIRTLRLVTLALSAFAAAWVLTPSVSAQFGLPGLDDTHAEAQAFHRVEDGLVLVAIEIDVEHGWHLYHEELGEIDGNEPVGKETTVELSADGVRFGRVRFPEPLELEQPGLGSWIWGHEGTIVLRAVGELDEGAELGKLRVELDGLTCEDLGTCVPYQASLTSRTPGPDRLFDDFPADLIAQGASVPADVAPEDGARDAEVAGAARGAGDAALDYAAVTFPAFTLGERGDEERGLGAWLLLAFVAGVILNVMPCVLPVISIKVLSFVQQAGEDRSRILALGLAFAAGIVVVFMGLATVAVVLNQGWGEQFQSPTFLVTMIGVVFAFGLSLFGVFELGVPAGVGGLAGAAPREGLGDAFFKGMLATALATPCSGPFLGSTLTWTLSQSSTVIFAVFLALGLGMALPYVVLTANPRLLKVVPRPGPWMDTFKQAMGFVLMATVVYLMISLRQDLLLFTIAFLVFVALGCWWWGRFANYNQTRLQRYGHLLIALALAGGGAQLAFGNLRGLFHTDETGEHAWRAFDPVEFVALLEAGENVMVDFTADWCPNCKYNEKFVYDDEEVSAAMAAKGVVRYVADITHGDARTDMIERLLDQLGSRSIPFMALFSGLDGEVATFRDIVTKPEVLAAVERMP